MPRHHWSPHQSLPSGCRTRECRQRHRAHPQSTALPCIRTDPASLERWSPGHGRRSPLPAARPMLRQSPRSGFDATRFSPSAHPLATATAAVRHGSLRHLCADAYAGTGPGIDHAIAARTSDTVSRGQRERRRRDRGGRWRRLRRGARRWSGRPSPGRGRGRPSRPRSRTRRARTCARCWWRRASDGADRPARRARTRARAAPARRRWRRSRRRPRPCSIRSTVSGRRMRAPSSAPPAAIAA